MKFIIGDLYYRRPLTIHTNGVIEEVFARGYKISRFAGNADMILEVKSKDDTFNIWQEDDSPWVHLGPGKIEDYPEYLL